jgi:VanZ family protein
VARLNMPKSVSTGLHPGYGLLSLAYMVAIYWLSAVPNIGLKDVNPVVSLASSLLHVPVYAGLTFCVSQALAGGDARSRRPMLFILTFLTVATYAALDEWHQSFVPGRAASVTDFLLGNVGIGAMLLFLRSELLRQADL